MPKACELKCGDLVEIQGAPFVLETLAVSTPSARGAASIYRLRFRNLITKAKHDTSCKGEVAFGHMAVERREVQYLFEQQGRYTFMDMEDFSQVELSADAIADAKDYLVDEMEDITLVIVNGKALLIEVPNSVDLAVIETAPAVRGASATARTKPATLQTGLIVQVPEYITVGERVKIDTRTGEFSKRA